MAKSEDASERVERDERVEESERKQKDWGAYQYADFRPLLPACDLMMMSLTTEI